MTNIIRYRTTGAVRGSCPHIHRSIEAAAECLRRDRIACARQGGYSDRYVIPTDGELSQSDADVADHLSMVRS